MPDNQHAQLHFILPGPIETPTGGFQYDRRIVEGLRAAGREVIVHELTGSFPFPGKNDLRNAGETLLNIDDGASVIVDGLVGGAIPDLLSPEIARLKLTLLIHHPLCKETGLSRETANALFASEKRALVAARRVIATSATTKKTIVAEFGIDADLVAVVPPGTDPAPVAFGSGDEVVNLLCLASLIPRKGHRDLLEALKRIEPRGWRLTCVGSHDLQPEYASTVLADAADHPAAARIQFTGAVDEADVARRLSEADLLVLPSHYEGFGMVITEALARGIPVLSTTGGAIPDTLPKDAGRLVAPGDPEALARALDELIRCRGALANLKRGAVDARETLIDWPETVRQFASVLEAHW